MAINEDAFREYKAANERGWFNGQFADYMLLPVETRKALMDAAPLDIPGAPIYSHDRWNKMIEAMFDEVRHLAKAKGGEYSGDTDRLLNFRRNAAALGLDPETIWAVYAAKHWDAVMQYVRDLREGKTRLRLEGIDGRIKDLIVYLLLLMAMVEERSDKE